MVFLLVLASGSELRTLAKQNCNGMCALLNLMSWIAVGVVFCWLDHRWVREPQWHGMPAYLCVLSLVDRAVAVALVHAGMCREHRFVGSMGSHAAAIFLFSL